MRAIGGREGRCHELSDHDNDGLLVGSDVA